LSACSSYGWLGAGRAGIGAGRVGIAAGTGTGTGTGVSGLDICGAEEARSKPHRRRRTRERRSVVTGEVSWSSTRLVIGAGHWGEREWAGGRASTPQTKHATTTGSQSIDDSTSSVLVLISPQPSWPCSSVDLSYDRIVLSFLTFIAWYLYDVGCSCRCTPHPEHLVHHPPRRAPHLVLVHSRGICGVGYGPN
jgi:hypothetical protein